MKTIWLSHILKENTPLYGGKKDIKITRINSINSGDSCNEGYISMPFHSGTHVDAPLHFIKNGKSISEFSVNDWIFKKPSIIKLKVEPGQLITPENLAVECNIDTDFIIIKTGFERFRGDDSYWESNPGLTPNCSEYLLDKYKKLRGIGFDFISISSFKHRNIGRIAHTSFLEKEILIFEDMFLKELEKESSLIQIIALPLRIDNCDGSPISIIGIIE